MLRDKETRKSKGVAWIQFVEYFMFPFFIARRESAEKAIEELNGTKVDVLDYSLLSWHSDLP